MQALVSFSTMEDAIRAQERFSYVPTQEEMVEAAKFDSRIDWWTRNGESREADGMWSDGFSLKEFCASSAIEDARKQRDRLLDGRLGVFRVFVRLEDNEIVAWQPEESCHPVFDWQTQYRWVVRNAQGRMQRDSEGRWMTYPVSPKRKSTHEGRGFAERWIVAPYRLVSRGETLGQAMKLGIMHSQLERQPIKEN